MLFYCKKSLLALLLLVQVLAASAEGGNHSTSNSSSSPDVRVPLKLIQDSLFNKSMEPIIDNLDPEFIRNWVEWIMEEEMIPGLSLCFLKDGEIYWQTHQGYADLQQQTAVNDQTAFVCGSVSKIIVLTSAMQLYEQNLLGLDDDVNQYLPFNIIHPDHPDETISIRHLMTHLSSIRDDGDLLESIITYGTDSNIPLGDFLEDYLISGGTYYNAQNYLADPPETSFSYSNIAVSLLAYIVEEVSGEDFEDYCQDNIFNPLGMDNVSFRIANMDPDLLATPYKQFNDTILPMPHIGLPCYPAGLLKSSAVNLAKFLGMYMSGGSYNQNMVLQQSTIDTIMRLQYPEILQENPMGLMWFYDFGFFRHGGSLPGAQAEIAFSRDMRSGLVTLGNSNKDEGSSFMEIFLLEYSRHYEPFSIEFINIIDNDEDCLLEAGEEAQVILDIKNNINLTSSISNMSLELHSNDPNVFVNNGTCNIGSMQYRDTACNASDPFIIQIGDHNAHYRSTLDLIVKWNANKVYETEIEIEIGAGEILLVNDAKSFGGMFMQPDFWYQQVLDSLDRDYYIYDVDLSGDPSGVFLANFPVVIWYTGSHYSNTLNEGNCEEISKYLEQGGRLFLSGQYISSELQDNDFLYEYLHTGYLGSSYGGSDSLTGIMGDPLGNGMVLAVNQGFDAYFQFSLAELQPMNGGEESFSYASSGNAGAIRFENDIYKTVFMGFGFEGINHFDNRLELMNRVLAYFGEILDAEETKVTTTDKVYIYPNPVFKNAYINFSLENSANAKLEIFNQQGILIKSRKFGNKKKGQHQLKLSTASQEAGVYYYRLLLDGESFTGKYIVL